MNPHIETKKSEKEFSGWIKKMCLTPKQARKRKIKEGTIGRE